MANASTFGQAPVDKNGPRAPDPQSPTSNGVDGVTGSNQLETPTVGAVNTSVPAGAGPQAQNVGTGFLNLQSLLAANAPQAQSMAQGLVNTAYQKGNAAQGMAAAGASNDDQIRATKDASDYANGLNSFGGLQGALQNQYKANSYNGGQSSFDALLAGGAGNQQFKQAQNAYGSLYQNLLANGPQTPASAQKPPANSVPHAVAPGAGDRIRGNAYNPKHNPRGKYVDDPLSGENP